MSTIKSASDCIVSYLIYQLECDSISGVWFGALLNGSIDTLTSGLMIHACSQLEVLKHSLTHIRQRAMRALHQHDELCSCGDDIWRCLRPVHLTQNTADLEQEVYKQLTQCILHHQAIFELVLKRNNCLTL